MTGYLICTRGLSKRYGQVAALDDCTLDVAAGEVVGLLGPNGAGKTTFVRLLLGYLQPTSGSAQIGGWDCFRESVEVRRLTAYLPGEPRLFGEMRGRDVLRFFSDLRKQDRVHAERLAERLALDVSVRVRNMSTGMRQKLALAAVLAAQVPVWILDEPTSNLDPAARAVVLATVQEAKAAGRTVLFSSHVLSEVEEVSDRVVMLRQGRIVCDLSMTQLRKKHRLYVKLAPHSEPPVCPAELTHRVHLEKLGVHAYRMDIDGAVGPVLHWLAIYPVDELQMEAVGLRTVYEQYYPTDPWKAACSGS